MKKLDCVGLTCPYPGYNTRKALDQLAPGEVLEVTTDLKAGKSDVPAMAKRLGYEVVSAEDKGEVFVFRIRKPEQ